MAMILMIAMKMLWYNENILWDSLDKFKMSYMYFEVHVVKLRVDF